MTQFECFEDFCLYISRWALLHLDAAVSVYRYIHEGPAPVIPPVSPAASMRELTVPDELTPDLFAAGTESGGDGIPEFHLLFATWKHSLLFSADLNLRDLWLGVSDHQLNAEEYLRNELKKARFLGSRMLTTSEYRLLTAHRDLALFDALRAFRKKLASDRGVSAYVIFSNRALYEIAANHPDSPERLLSVNGVGERILENYGEQILDFLDKFIARETSEASMPCTESDQADFI